MIVSPTWIPSNDEMENNFFLTVQFRFTSINIVTHIYPLKANKIYVGNIATNRNWSNTKE